ncbi:MAG: hypothetical protein GQ570_14165 [Helicobacteraceae bacterium]|nr:hypothetical protein [Helicobacteraceae bacterium]
MEIKPLETEKFLTTNEIELHLVGVEYIIMASPSLRETKTSPVQFTIFLNTSEKLPLEVKEAVLKKFCDQYSIVNICDVLSELAPVAFAKTTTQESIMPLHLFKEEEIKNIPNTKIHVIDFEGNSDQFKEAKDGLTGWSYSYN